MYFLMRLLGWTTCRFSPKGLEKFARLLAFFLFDIARFRRGLVIGNLQKAFGETITQDERIRIGRTSLSHFILLILEVFYSQENDIVANITVDGKDNMDKALERKQGAYVLCCHQGNWEAMGGKYTRSIVPAYVIVKKIGVKGVNRYIEEMREKNQFLSIKRKQRGDAFKHISQVLDDNHGVGFVMDQARPGEPRLEFFGHPAKTNTSFAAIWRRKEAPILPSFMIRHGFNRHTVYIWPELEMTKTTDEKADILRQSQEFNLVVEKIIRTAPDQYFWMHNRWK